MNQYSLCQNLGTKACTLAEKPTFGYQSQQRLPAVTEASYSTNTANALIHLFRAAGQQNIGECCEWDKLS